MTELHLGDCLDVLPTLPDGCIDLVLADPPYGTTECKWDTVIDLELMWRHLKRVTKPKGAIALMAGQPFTSVLVSSNYKMFRYEWIWEKAAGSNFTTLKFQPMKEHESILVFSSEPHNYYPIMQNRKGTAKGKAPDYSNTVSKSRDGGGEAVSLRSHKRNRDGKQYGALRNPSSVQYFNNRIRTDRGLHSTQKPVALMEYFIRTYSESGDTVLDFTMGSGTTGIACLNTDRSFVGIEIDKNYFDVAVARLEEHRGGLE